MLEDQAVESVDAQEAVASADIKEIPVRIAGPQDEEAVYDFLCHLHAENGLFPLSKERALQTIRRGTNHQGGIIGLIEGPNGIEGSIGLALDQWWYTDAWQLLEMWIYVLPEHRGNERYEALVDFGKQAADRLNIPLQVGIVSLTKPELKLRLYKKLMRLVGGLFMYGLPEQDR